MNVAAIFDMSAVYVEQEKFQSLCWKFIDSAVHFISDNVWDTVPSYHRVWMYFQYSNRCILHECVMNMFKFRVLSLSLMVRFNWHLCFLATVVEKLLLSVPSKYIFINLFLLLGIYMSM